MAEESVKKGTSKLSLGRKHTISSTMSNNPPSSIGKPKTTQGTLEDAVRNMFTTDSSIMIELQEAVSSILLKKILQSQDIISIITQNLCQDGEFIESISKSVASQITEKVSDGIYRSTKYDMDCIDDKTGTNKDSIKSLEDKINTLSAIMDDQEQYSRRNCLLIHGIPEFIQKKEGDKEDTDQAALDLINNHLDVKVTATDIDRTHRIGIKKTTEDENGKPNSRPIIIKFVSYAKRSAVYGAKSKLKGSRKLITESLTPRRMEILRKAKESDSIDSVWSYDGRVKCTNHAGKRFTLFTANDIDRI